MKRRSFLGRLAALVVAPAVVPELVKAEPAIELKEVGRLAAADGTLGTGSGAHAKGIVVRAMLERIAADLQMIVVFPGPVAIFQVPAPWGVAFQGVTTRFTVGLTKPADRDWSGSELRSQVHYQLRKKLEEIERVQRWRGTPPGISVRASRGVASIGSGDYFFTPSDPVYEENDSWKWERV